MTRSDAGPDPEFEICVVCGAMTQAYNVVCSAASIRRSLFVLLWPDLQAVVCGVLKEALFSRSSNPRPCSSSLLWCEGSVRGRTLGGVNWSGASRIRSLVPFASAMVRSGILSVFLGRIPYSNSFLWFLGKSLRIGGAVISNCRLVSRRGFLVSRLRVES
ncbi:uncharacterized protein BO95DRAFT_268387 [Aspergillus brunneoviolaceus CBS 621.78]|uniref:Uncharacterized protein n=1 Tax=Aspergillus brunneoviolaceus CBS 621.78 TaxID=1450534 RepID=A0ACD1GJY5_9EURO|nr:hypothetical protein BO95DRAFT_268387 [Aspergillus brunneoviolaceus CBS 621.78]RAH49532.1 hypothetical protein BO95DRAFT_268387 [Aspergillus brunneoviolaceus CBS 621.78]